MSSFEDDDSSSDDDENNSTTDNNDLYNDSIGRSFKYPPKLQMLSGKSDRLRPEETSPGLSNPNPAVVTQKTPPSSSHRTIEERRSVKSPRHLRRLDEPSRLETTLKQSPQNKLNPHLQALARKTIQQNQREIQRLEKEKIKGERERIRKTSRKSNILLKKQKHDNEDNNHLKEDDNKSDEDHLDDDNKSNLYNSVDDNSEESDGRRVQDFVVARQRDNNSSNNNSDEEKKNNSDEEDEEIESESESQSTSIERNGREMPPPANADARQRQHQRRDRPHNANRRESDVRNTSRTGKRRRGQKGDDGARRRRMRPGMAALREIRKYQSTGDLLLLKEPFK